MTSNVILLTHDFQFLNLISRKKAIKLIVKERVEVVKNTDRELCKGFYLPKAIRLLKKIETSINKQVPFSKKSVFMRDHYKCQYCGKQLKPKTATIDHVVPRAKGGKNGYLNCVTACKPCNNWKSDQALSETNMQLLKPPVHPTFAEFMYHKMVSLGIDLKEIWE